MGEGEGKKQKKEKLVELMELGQIKRIGIEFPALHFPPNEPFSQLLARHLHANCFR